MALTYIRGRSGSGKTDVLIKQIKSLLNQNPLETIYVLVPEQATFRMERELIDAIGRDGLWGVSVLSFDRLVQILLSKYGGINDTPLDFIGKTMIVRTILDENKENLSVFKRSASQPGFEIKVTEQLSELKRQDVTLEQLTKIKSEDIDPTIQQKLDDICLLYDAYQRHIDQRYLDDADLISLAIDAASTHGFFSDTHIFADGFDLLTNQLLRLLTLAISQAKSAVITFKMYAADDPDKRVFDPEIKRYNMINRAAKTGNLDVTKIDLFPKDISHTRFQADDIYHLEKSLFAYPFKIYSEKPKNISLAALDNRQHEVKTVCAKIIAHISEGYRFKDIALCVSDIKQYRSIIVSAFSANHIPYFMDAKTKLLDTAIAEFLCGLLDFLIFKDIEDFIVHVKSGFLDIDSEGLYAFENFVKQYAIKGYQLNHPFKRASESVEAVRAILSEPVFKLMDKIKSVHTAEAYGPFILDYLKQLSVDEQIEAFTKTLESSENLDSALMFSQVFEKIVDIVKQSCTAFKDSQIPFESFVSATKAGLEAAEIAIIPPSTDDVLVGDFNRTVFPDTKILFVLGLNDGQIPSAPDTASVLTDAEKMTLEKQGIRAGYRDRFFEERLKIYTIFSKPSEKLFLSYTNNGEKDEAKPSVLVGRFNRIFPKLETEKHDTRTDIYPQISSQELFNDLSFALSQKLDGMAINDQWRDVYALFTADSDYQRRLDILKKRLLTLDKSESMRQEIAHQLYTPFKTSVSRAERYYACPYLYFMDYGIMPQKLEPFETSPLDIGNFLHDCMHRFVLYLKNNDLYWRDLDDSLIEKIVDTVADKLKNTHKNGIFIDSERSSYVFSRLRLEFLSAAKVIRDQLKDTRVNVYQSELLLKDADYLIFTLADGTAVSLTCKIDRVDSVDYDGTRIIRIIDYKSSGKTPSLKELYYGLTLQLMIYLKFVVAYFQSMGETVKIGGALYMDLSLPQTRNNTPENILSLKTMNGFISNDANTNLQLSRMDEQRFVAMKGRVNKDNSMRKSDFVLSESAFDILFKHSESMMINAMNDILNGDVTPLPYRDGPSKTACDFCDYAAVCGFDSDIDVYRDLSDKKKSDFGIED